MTLVELQNEARRDMGKKTTGSDFLSFKRVLELASLELQCLLNSEGKKSCEGDDLESHTIDK